MRKSTLWIIILGTLISSHASAFKLSGFETPESFLVDPEDGSYYVSNISGDPLAKDSNGYISKITANGNTVVQKFIGEKKDEMPLHAPKGLLISGKILFVTDIDTVKGFYKSNGKPAVLVDLAGWNVTFLNDLAMDKDGLIYVSDMLANRIFSINPKKNYEVKLFKSGPELGNPNGLMVNPKTKYLMVVTWGSGQILEIDRRTGKVFVVKKGLMGLDGIDSDGEGNLYVSSFQKGEIYKIPNLGRGTLTTFEGGLKTPADISFDRKRKEVLVPSFEGNTVETVPVVPVKKAEKSKDLKVVE